MDTAEAAKTSGAKDHRSDKHRPHLLRLIRNGTHQRLQKSLHSRRLLVSFSAALLFVFVSLDFFQTLNSAQAQLDATTHMLAGTLNGATTADAVSVIQQIAPRLGDSTSISLLTSEETVLASTHADLVNLAAISLPSFEYQIRSHQIIPGPLHALAGARHLSSVFAPSALRAIIATSTWLILLISLISLKRPTTSITPQLPLTNAFLESLPQAASYWSADGKCISVNGLFRKVLPAHCIDLTGLPTYAETLKQLSHDREFTNIEDGEKCRRSELKCAKLGTMFLEEYPVADGGFIALISSPVDNDKISAKLGDAQEQLALLSQQIETQKANQSPFDTSTCGFVDNLNHELRTPLNHIIGFSDLLRHQSYGKLGDERYLDYADHIKQSGQALLETLSHMIEAAASQPSATKTDINVSRLSDTLEILRQQHKNRSVLKGISFKCDLSDDAFVAIPEKTLLKIINNVLQNAFQLTGPGEQVTVATWVAEDGVVLEITDNGAGISPTQMAFIDKYTSIGVDESEEDTLDPYQTGLVVAQRLVSQINGEMQVNSTEGVGTTVAICLPCDVEIPSITAQDAA